MNIEDTLAPKGDQLDAVELVGGARIFRIANVSKGNAEQPVNVHLENFPRPWRPGKSMRRVLVAAWGGDASQYVGRRVELFCDMTVVFGGEVVGGTRISRMSHIDKDVKVPLLIKRGKSQVFVVKPLPDAPDASEPSADEVAASTSEKQLREWWKTSSPERKAQIEARVAELKGGAS